MNALVIGVIILIVIVAIGGGGFFFFKSSQSTTVAETATVAENAVATPVATGGTASTPPPALTGTSAIELGQYPQQPWGSASAFIDPTAVWMWNTSDAEKTAPATAVKFENQYYNSTSTAIPAVMHVIADDSATVSINGTQVGTAAGGWAAPSYPQIAVSLQPGNSIINIVATNAGGPAGLLVSLVKTSDKSVLLHSDKSWITSV